jgi:hypothetical protein
MPPTGEQSETEILASSPVKRWLRRIVPTVCSLLFVLALVLWAISVEIPVLGIDWISPRYSIWQFYSSNGVSISHISQWREPAALYVMKVWRSYSNVDGFFLAMTNVGGAHSRRQHIAGFEIDDGTECVLINADGRTYRISQTTPVPTPMMAHLSAPKPYFTVIVPYWALVVLFGAMPVWWCFMSARTRILWSSRVLGARCVACGYDLRGTPDRCPECGAVPRITERDRARARRLELFGRVLALLWRRAVGFLRRLVLGPRGSYEGAALLMLFYLALAYLATAYLEGGWNPERFRYQGALALLLVFIGAFHAAKYCRQKRVFFAYGIIGGLMPYWFFCEADFSPQWDMAKNHTLFFCWMAFSVAAGAVAVLCASLRWRSNPVAPIPASGRCR